MKSDWKSDNEKFSGLQYFDSNPVFMNNCRVNKRRFNIAVHAGFYNTCVKWRIGQKGGWERTTPDSATQKSLVKYFLISPTCYKTATSANILLTMLTYPDLEKCLWIYTWKGWGVLVFTLSQTSNKY